MLDDDLGSFKFDNEKLFNCNTPIIDNKYLLLCCVSDNFEKIYELKEYTCYQFILENDGDKLIMILGMVFGLMVFLWKLLQKIFLLKKNIFHLKLFL